MLATEIQTESLGVALEQLGQLDPRIARLKEKLLTAPYEICLARAHYFTAVYKETEGMDPALRNALGLQRTLQKQKIFIYPDEFLVGSKTEKFLAQPLSVDRGDFLRSIAFELPVLHLKHHPFLISDEEKKIFLEEIFPYWSGHTMRDYKARIWEQKKLITPVPTTFKEKWRDLKQGMVSIAYPGIKTGMKMLGAITKMNIFKVLKRLIDNQYELARNNPTPAVYCFDVQGHLSLGVDKVVEKGMAAIISEAKDRITRLERDEPANEQGKNFLKAAILSLEAAIEYSERFATLAEEMAAKATDNGEKKRLAMIAEMCRWVPRNKPRTFHEAVQAAHFTLLVGEIQYGTHEVFAVGRSDQYLYPYYQNDIKEGRLTRQEAVALLQEFYLRLTANAEPIPEVGMETNGVLGNSQHCIAIGGLTKDGADATNELSMRILDAHAQMKGAINQLSVRFHKGSPDAFVRRTAEVFRYANGIAIYNDEAIIPALVADGMSIEDARDYCIVGCIETSGQSNTHGCPGGHEMVLPCVMLMTISRGRLPPPTPGMSFGTDCGDPREWDTWEKFLDAFKRQMDYNLHVLVEAAAGKDTAYRDILPAPYVSALMSGCIEKARDITNGGAKYDFTSIDVRGLGSAVDGLMAIKYFVYDKKEIPLMQFIKIVKKSFKGNEVLRQRILHEPPHYGVGNPEADNMALQIIDWIYAEAQKYKNIRGGKFRPCFYSYGNHLIDGLMLRSTPDGRLRAAPTSNGVSPSNIIPPPDGPMGPMTTVAKFPPEKVSSGVALNMRFHPNMLKTDNGLQAFADLIRTYFKMGGMHLQPNVVSTETLRDAQAHPEQYKDLVVKVSGYSAYFCDLGKMIQEDIIARTEFH